MVFLFPSPLFFVGIFAKIKVMKHATHHPARSFASNGVNRNFFVFWGVLTLVFFVFPGISRAMVAPNDPMFSEQWYLRQISAPEAWERGAGERDVVVAILDSGVDIDHPDLQNNIWLNRDEKDNGKDNDGNGYAGDLHGWDFVDNDNNPRPSFLPAYTDRGANHGTVMAGLISALANNNQGIAGVSWRSMIMPLRVLDSTGVGSSRSVERAIDYAIANHATIINLSFISKDYSESFKQAIKRAYDAGIIIVAAAGNEKDTRGVNMDFTREYPVCYDGPEGENWVLGVAATDVLDQRAPFSNYGKSCIDVAAPGMDMLSTVFYDRTRRGFLDFYRRNWSGTSLATALVSGAAALLKSYAPELTNKEVYDYLRSGTDDISGSNPGYEGQLGAGRINIKKSLDLIAREVVAASVPLGKSAYGGYIIQGTEPGDKSAVSILEQNGTPRVTFYPFEKYSGGINVAVGNVTGKESRDIVVGTAAGAGPQVRIFSPEGKLLDEIWAFDKNRKSGVNVAVGDFLGYGSDQIVAAEDAGGSSRIRFWVLGEPSPRREFPVFKEPWRGGVRLWAADIDYDGAAEIIVAPAAAQLNPEVKVYRADGVLLSSFSPFGKGFRGILEVAPGKFSDWGYVDLAIAPKTGGGPQIIVWSVFGRKLDPGFFAFESKYRGGVSLAAKDINEDGSDELIVARRATGNAREIKVFNSTGGLYNTIKPENGSIFKHGANVNALIE